MAKVITIALTLFVGFGSPSIQAAEDAGPAGFYITHRGNDHGAPACTLCHGKTLQGDAKFKAPALAGLTVPFILSRLAHYAGPDGHNASMRQVAVALSLQQREAVAEYLSHLSGKVPGN